MGTSCPDVCQYLPFKKHRPACMKEATMGTALMSAVGQDIACYLQRICYSKSSLLAMLTEILPSLPLTSEQGLHSATSYNFVACLHLDFRLSIARRWATAVVAAMSFQASSRDAVAGELPEVSQRKAENGKVSLRWDRARCAVAKSSTVLNDGRPVTPETSRSDAWTRRYVQKSPTGKAAVANSNGNGVHERKNEISDVSASNMRPGMPARKHSKHLRAPMMSPRIEDVEETITRAFGSVLDPQSKRAKWACAACNSMFVRVRSLHSVSLDYNLLT